ncbi:uncharacterized protein MCYG_00801 [Microsporum canis CBS 113480]|uniref:Uncharacterized protein n=1 Tax=Arthroderma otae (strain ATCC MYA-4605 / CBS 113480) TaxID=554155 RepID=C5FDD9_ARTOC|nr:uncharacterized protein MCYG_00801 [Microsporum canis CBS 113480]EEQ27913.1 predicted protein [Microsporum canis CBS 113480]
MAPPKGPPGSPRGRPAAPMNPGMMSPRGASSSGGMQGQNPVHPNFPAPMIPHGDPARDQPTAYSIDDLCLRPSGHFYNQTYLDYSLSYISYITTFAEFSKTSNGFIEYLICIFITIYSQRQETATSGHYVRPNLLSLPDAFTRDP